MLGILVAVMMQAAAPAQAAPPRPSVITNPDWARKPSGEDMMRFYPKAAADSGVEGAATLHCEVAATGDLVGCRADSETPTGQGFAEAALALAPTFKMKAQTKDGVPVDGGKINIPIRFRLPKPQNPLTVELALECYGASAALTEQDPRVAATRAATFTWQVIAQALSESETPKPSEMEARLAAARKLGATAAPQLRATCNAYITPEMVASFQAMMSKATTAKP